METGSENKRILLDGEGDQSSSNHDHDEYVRSLPVGFRFKPTDKELIDAYLINKKNNRNLPNNRIKKVELYSYKTPEELTATYELIREKEWYFFTSRSKKYQNGCRLNRITPGGYWKPTGADITILCGGGRILGKKKTLCFYRGPPKDGRKTDWIMHEYRVHEEEEELRRRAKSETKELDDCVLCKVFKRTVGKKQDTDSGSSNAARNLREVTSQVQSDTHQQLMTVVQDQSLLPQQVHRRGMTMLPNNPMVPQYNAYEQQNQGYFGQRLEANYNPMPAWNYGSHLDQYPLNWSPVPAPAPPPPPLPSPSSSPPSLLPLPPPPPPPRPQYFYENGLQTMQQGGYGNPPGISWNAERWQDRGTGGSF